MAIKERPILFNAEMVRAILEGRKTQTRRVVKFPNLPTKLGSWESTTIGGEGVFTIGKDGVKVPAPEEVGMWHTQTGKLIACPYGKPGDRLWVRETWAAPHKYDHLPPRLISKDANLYYPATEDTGGLIKRPSIHMPRWASRIDFEITNIRVKRVQDISSWDAWAEGVSCGCTKPIPQCAGNVAAFHELWVSINGPESWDANPWVWVVEFKRVEARN